MSKILLINPSYKNSYGNGKSSIINPVHPTLSLMTIAATALKKGHDVQILDLCYQQYHYQTIKNKIETYKPDIVGVTGTTPLMNQARDISCLVKGISKNIISVIGGPHVSALPYESLKESLFDIAVVGEGDFTFGEIADGHSFKDIQGIYYRTAYDGEIYSNPLRNFVQNLDDLPFPALHLYDASAYDGKVSYLWAKRTPITLLEFSRGCVYKCNFCASKNTMALGYRKKSPERCAEEVKYIAKLGYREFAVADDIFTSDNKWAVQVCEAIIRANTHVIWTCTNGIRVESADDRLFKTMKKAGCYRVSFGFESGNDEVLKKFGKGGKASIEQGAKAVKLARKAGLDTLGMFMLGLSHDTEKTMMDTIRFAKTVIADMLKFGKTIAFPGTSMFEEYRKEKLIRSYNWDEYFIYTDKTLFVHRYLSYDTIDKYAQIAYKEAVLKNPRFIMHRIIRGIKKGEVFLDIYYFIKWFFSPPFSNQADQSVYFAKDKWPTYDFENNPLRTIPVRMSNNKVAALN